MPNRPDTNSLSPDSPSPDSPLRDANVPPIIATIAPLAVDLFGSWGWITDVNQWTLAGTGDGGEVVFVYRLSFYALLSGVISHNVLEVTYNPKLPHLLGLRIAGRLVFTTLAYQGLLCDADIQGDLQRVIQSSICAAWMPDLMCRHSQIDIDYLAPMAGADLNEQGLEMALGHLLSVIDSFVDAVMEILDDALDDALDDGNEDDLLAMGNWG